mgnify:CR=1 FL=1
MACLGWAVVAAELSPSAGAAWKDGRASTLRSRAAGRRALAILLTWSALSWRQAARLAGRRERSGLARADCQSPSRRWRRSEPRTALAKRRDSRRGRGPVSRGNAGWWRDQPGAFLNLGRALAADRRRSRRRAVEPFRRLVELAVAGPRATSISALAPSTTPDETSEAVAAFTRAVELDPRSVRALESLGTALWRQGGGRGRRALPPGRRARIGDASRVGISRCPGPARTLPAVPDTLPARRESGATTRVSEDLHAAHVGQTRLPDVLRQEGVQYMFGNPGTTEPPLMDGLGEEPALTYVLALQEAAVVAGGRRVRPGLGQARRRGAFTWRWVWATRSAMLYDAQKAGTPLSVTAGQHDSDLQRH